MGSIWCCHGDQIEFLLFTCFGAWLFVNIALNQIHKLSLYWYLGSKIKMDIIWMFHSCRSQWSSFVAIIPIPTYVEYVCNSKHLASSVKWKTHRILVREWDMKLGITPSQSAWKNLSNDVLKVDFNVGHIFAKNCTEEKAIIHGFSWFWVKIQHTAKWTLFEHSIHADHNGASPTPISHS